VWHDGAIWRVALDTSDLYTTFDTNGSSSSSSEAKDSSGSKQQGLLADFTPLADFAEERKYGVFSEQDGCAYAVKVYDEGKTLSIVVDAGAHGTHVSQQQSLVSGCQIAAVELSACGLQSVSSSEELTPLLSDGLSRTRPEGDAFCQEVVDALLC
jgi:hypothetical protein